MKYFVAGLSIIIEAIAIVNRARIPYQFTMNFTYGITGFGLVDSAALIFF